MEDTGPITRLPKQEYEKMLQERLDPLNKGIEQLKSDIEKTKQDTSKDPSKDPVEQLRQSVKQEQLKPSTGTAQQAQDQHGHQHNEGIISSGISEGISCTTCGGHNQKLLDDGLTVKCQGKDCGKEYIMIPRPTKEDVAKNKEAFEKGDAKIAAWHDCLGCGQHIPNVDPKKYKLNNCPFCGYTKSTVTDFDNIGSKRR